MASLPKFKKIAACLLAMMCVWVLFIPMHAYANEEEQPEQNQPSEEELEQQMSNGNILFFGGGEETEDPFLDDEYIPEDDGEDMGVDISAVSGTGKVARKDVNMRADADINAEVLFTLTVGSKVDVLNEKDGWYLVNYGIMQGYMRNDMVLLIDEDGRNGLVQTDGVKLRATPTITPPEGEDNVVTQLKVGNNTQITDVVMGLHDEMAWYKIKFSGNEGYVRSDNMELRGTFTGEQELAMLKPGMDGDGVKAMQKSLIKRGFLASSGETGVYDKQTSNAVKDFQKAAKLTQDGVAGVDTLESIHNSNIVKTISDKSGVKGKVKLTDWNTVSKTIKRGTVYTVIDVKTGISWKERRMGGWYHSDSEPLTAADTANMKRTVGSWTWNRRAIWVVVGGNVYAASMNVMPHLGSTISGNNFPGHHCIHFYKSKVHANSKECPRHQACVRQAYNAGK